MAGPWEKYQGAAPDAGPWTKYGGAATPVTPDPNAPPDAGAQMRQSAINKIPAELSGLQPRSSRIFHTGIPNIDRPDTTSPPIPAFDQSPASQMAEGAERAAEPGFDNKAAGASGMIRGLGRAAAGGAIPLLGAGLATAPLATIGGAAVGSAGAYGGGKLARLGAQKLGGGEGAQDLAQDVGEGVGGAVAGPPLMKLAGKTIKAPAAPIAETALGIRGAAREHGATPGEAILGDTSGVQPATVERSATNKIAQLTKEVESRANRAGQSGVQMSLAPARAIVSGAIDSARAGNSIPNELIPLREHLNVPHKGFGGAIDQPPAPIVNTPITGQNGPLLGANGQPITRPTAGALPPAVISEKQHPLDFLGMKRRFGKDFTNFRPGQSTPESIDVANKTYGQMARDFDAGVPGGQGLNQRIQSLIPVADRAHATDLNASPLQKTLGRIARPTGALVAAAEGFRHFGIPGALVGLGLPEAISSPVAQLITARGLNAAGNALQTKTAASAARLMPLLRVEGRDKKKDAE